MEVKQKLKEVVMDSEMKEIIKVGLATVFFGASMIGLFIVFMSL